MLQRGTVQGVGTGGIVKDTMPGFLPKATWSDGRNIRILKDKLIPMGGAQHIDTITQGDVFWVGFANGVVNRYYLFSDGTDLFAFNGTTVNEITRTSGGDYSATMDRIWDLEMYNGLALVNNGADIPQQWNPSDITNKAANLSNWDTNWRAKKFVAYGPILIALNMTESGTAFPHKIRWSHPADPGAMPGSWDISDPTKLAGTNSLTDTGRGEIISGMKLGEEILVYKEQSIWIMRFVGGTSIFSIKPLHPDVGLFLPRSLVSLRNPKTRAELHFIGGEDNFYLVNQGGCEPLFNGVFRDEYLKLVDDTYYRRSFSVNNHKHNELWFCFPEKGMNACTLAFVWNYRDDTYSIKELSGTLSVAEGLSFNAEGINSEVDLPHSDTTMHADTAGYWDELEIKSRLTLVEASVPNEKLYYLETGDLSYDGNPQECYIERRELADRPLINGDSVADFQRRKMVQAVAPKLYTGSVGIMVGAQEARGLSMQWGEPMTLNDMTYKVRLSRPVSGRLIAFRFYKLPNDVFEFGGYEYDVAILGEY